MTSITLTGFEPVFQASKACRLGHYLTEFSVVLFSTNYLGLVGIEPTLLPRRGSVLPLNYRPSLE